MEHLKLISDNRRLLPDDSASSNQGFYKTDQQKFAKMQYNSSMDSGIFPDSINHKVDYN